MKINLVMTCLLHLELTQFGIEKYLDQPLLKIEGVTVVGDYIVASGGAIINNNSAVLSFLQYIDQKI